MDQENRKITFSDVIIFIIFLVLVFLPIYFFYQMFFAPKVDSNNNTQDTQTNVTQEETPVEEPKIITYEENIINKEISGQIAYIAVPKEVEEQNPPAIVLYQHGSNTRVTTDLEDPFMMDMIIYGEFFSSNNFIFAASNEHDENWGNAQSVADMLNLYQWIKSNYATSEKIYLIGFSMGGLPTMHFAVKYPENIAKIALLAPTTREYEISNTQIELLKNIDIKIWHGTSDVNIGVQSSRNFVNNLKTKGKEIPLIELDGKTHFDLDVEYKEEVLKFFQES